MGIVLGNALICIKKMLHLCSISHVFLNDYIISETEVDILWCKFVQDLHMHFSSDGRICHRSCFALRTGWPEAVPVYPSQYFEMA